MKQKQKQKNFIKLLLFSLDEAKEKRKEKQRKEKQRKEKKVSRCGTKVGKNHLWIENEKFSLIDYLTN